MKKRAVLATVLLALTFCITPAYAIEISTDVELNTGLMGGETTYQIGGTVTSPTKLEEIHFPLSELEFPLEFISETLAIRSQIGNRLNIEAELTKNITDDWGEMKDSDWLTPGVLDIYSESDSEIDATIIDLSASINVVRTDNMALLLGTGYIRQDFEYDITDTHQWSPSGRKPDAVQAVPGKVLTYDITYDIPYASAGIKSEISRFIFDFALGYAPYVMIEDEDNHILRNKQSTGDCDGTAFMAKASTRVDIKDGWFMKAGGSYMNINTDGEQDQTAGGIYTATIDQDIESEQISGFIGIGFTFD